MAGTSASLTSYLFFALRLEWKADGRRLSTVAVVRLNVFAGVELVLQAPAEDGNVRILSCRERTIGPTDVSAFDGYGNLVPDARPVGLVRPPPRRESGRLEHSEVDTIKGQLTMLVVAIFAITVL